MQRIVLFAIIKAVGCPLAARRATVHTHAGIHGILQQRLARRRRIQQC